MWSLIGLVVSAIGVFVEYMGDKEEKAESEKRIGDLELKVQQLENQRRLDDK